MLLDPISLEQIRAIVRETARMRSPDWFYTLSKEEKRCALAYSAKGKL